MSNLPITIPAFVPVALEVLIAVLSGCFVALSVSLVVWTYRDIRSRSRDVLVQLLAALLVLVFNVFGLLLYRLLRPRETLAEAYERALEEEALLQDIEERQSCPSCRQAVKADYLVCPNCHTQLKKACTECKKLLNLRWSVCPYCGAAATPTAGAPEPAATASAVTAR
jgi:RNA polymerase subunit RPABC4/transcription elongation factor Spt4